MSSCFLVLDFVMKFVHVFAIASNTLSARTFDVPRLKYLRNCISCFSSPKDPSAWILLFSLRRIHLSERIRSKSSFRYFRNQVHRGDQTFQREFVSHTEQNEYCGSGQKWHDQELDFFPKDT